MVKKKRFSIITISFNAEECIERTMKSVLSQGYNDIEYLFIDGGSSDLTNDIIETYKDKFNSKGITVKHLSESDKGISDAFNKGITMAEGEIIVILNADDELLPGSLLEIDKEFAESIDILYGNAIWYDTQKNTKKLKKAGRDLSQLLYRMILIHPATFVRKRAYEKYGLFDLSYKFCMDKELIYRMYRAGAKFKYVDRGLALMKSGGVSDKNTVKVIKEGERMEIYYGVNPIKAKFNSIDKIIKTKLVKIYRSLLR